MWAECWKIDDFNTTMEVSSTIEDWSECKIWDIFNELKGKCIKNKELTIENKEIDELIATWEVSQEQLEAIWERIYELTPSKIIIIGFMLWAEDIKEIWVQKLIDMSVDELNAEI